ncbi:MAG: hypothetical protein ACLPSL_13625 [Smithella sp.]
MNKNKIINSLKTMAPGFYALTLINCGGFGAFVNMPIVKDVPAGQYERIIKLNNSAMEYLNPDMAVAKVAATAIKLRWDQEK